MKSACLVPMRVLGYFLLLLLLTGVAGCSTTFERPVRIEPAKKHDQQADRKFCRDYAERYGVINLGPVLGDDAPNQPDRRRRNRLFILCMEEKGYRF